VLGFVAVGMHGHEVVLSNPKKTHLLADACLKNDHVDTDQLLHLLRLGHLRRVWIPPAPLRYGIEVLRYRVLLVRMRTGATTTAFVSNALMAPTYCAT
jgi:hypothetical protein